MPLPVRIIQSTSAPAAPLARSISGALADSRNPDVLLCLANLSSDEVFTSPALANAMLDTLPYELWSDPNATFLDPCAKEGVFLREIVIRLYHGLKDVIPDDRARIHHILSKQVFGLALTALTALVTRRTLYTNKDATHSLSLSDLGRPEGNVLFREHAHTFKSGSCVHCGFAGDPNDPRDRNYHAYLFLHADLPKLFAQEGFPMKFNVIIGNPPYQLEDGGHGASAAPIYHHFVGQAMKLNPDHLVMITPSRWFAGGKGLNEYREKMLNDDRLVKLVDYPDPRLVFPDVSIKGGVSFFQWSANYHGLCEVTTITATGLDANPIDSKTPGNNRPHVIETRVVSKRALNEYPVFVRWSEALPILDKVQAVIKSQKLATMDTQVSSSKPFGIRTNIKGNKSGDIIFYGQKSIGYFKRKDLLQNNEPGGWVDQWKVLASAAYGAGDNFPHQIAGKPFVAAPGSACSETYNVIGVYPDELSAKRLAAYYASKVFRFLVFLMKNTQHLNKDRYGFVPILPLDRDWTDAELIKYFGLTENDVALIDRMIKPLIPILVPPQPGSNPIDEKDISDADNESDQ